MTHADVLGWIGNVGFIAGAVLIARKSIWGLWLNVFGNLCYIVVGLLSELPSLFVCSLVLLLINIYGIYHWSKLEKT